LTPECIVSNDLQRGDTLSLKKRHGCCVVNLENILDHPHNIE